MSLINWLNVYPERWVFVTMLIMLFFIVLITLLGDRIVYRGIRAAQDRKADRNSSENEDFLDRVDEFRESLQEQDAKDGIDG